MSMTTAHIRRRRGDTNAIRVCVKDLVGAADITGAIFKLTINQIPYPDTTEQQVFQLLGEVVDGAGGIVDFLPDEAAADNVGFFWFDLEMEDPAGFKDTIMFGWYEVKQDITKDEPQPLVIGDAAHAVSDTGQ